MLEIFRRDAYRWAIHHLGRSITSPEQLTTPDLVRLLYQNMALRAIAWFRLGSWLKHKRVPFLPGLIQRQIFSRYGLEIVVGAEIGGGLYIAHPVGTVIAPKRIGVNCSIIAAVTIGMRNEWSFPTIGDDVFIGAGARVLGGITIGNGAIIGANAVVINDLPENVTAVGIPAKIARSATTLAV
ncbi:MAG: DapH/DapD/GlmU-related protein [Kouleothrix sp.]|jgi:serine O-acetyltransferase|nr:serine acetyltransferase [Kouleothrix sp.]